MPPAIVRLVESQSIAPECEFALEIPACQAIVIRQRGAMRAAKSFVVVTLPLAKTNVGRG